jgi:hypothetical protein
MTWFINLTSPAGVETIDVASSERDAERLLGEYRMAYFPNPELRVWLSHRSWTPEAGDQGPELLAELLELRSLAAGLRSKSRGPQGRSSSRTHQP